MDTAWQPERGTKGSETVETLLASLRGAAEPTRLRILAVLAKGELTVSELTQVLGQSQPRVSRHLKLMGDAGLLERFREGSWVFYRLADAGPGAGLAHALLDLLPTDDPLLALDRDRLAAVRHARAETAAAYFRANADHWHRIRSLHVDERVVERTILDALDGREVGDLLDVGTGTGRMLELLGPRARRAVGVDMSYEMLRVARANLAQSEYRHVQARHGDMYQLALPGQSFDTVVFHQVLHYAADPQAALAEAARVLRPGGRVLVVDFAPHQVESLRTEHAHRRLGFADDEVSAWCRGVGLDCRVVAHLAGTPLTVTIWLASSPARRDLRPASVPGLAAGAPHVPELEPVS